VSSLALVLSSVLGLAVAQGGTAEAGRGHFSGSVRIGGGVRFRGGVSVRVGRPIYRPRVWVGGRWWWRGWYWPRPYYYYYYYYPYPESVPSYYGGSYYPVQPEQSVAAPGAVAVAPRREPLPVFGFGAFAGGTRINGMDAATELGVLARLRLTEGLLIEGELSKDTIKGEFGQSCPNTPCTLVAVSGERINRRIGGSLIYEIGARHAFAPYVLAGGGVQQAKVSGDSFFGSDFTTTQEFGEIGFGLRLALSRNIYLTADVRAGRAKTIDSNQDNRVVPLARTIAPPPNNSSNDTEDFTRGRLAAIVNF
jgi:hypothetical protein